MKTQLAELLKRVEAARSTVDAARAELTGVEKAIRRLINGPNQHAAQAIAKSRGKMVPAKKEAHAGPPPLTTPVGVPCPRCGGPMEVRFSRQQGTYFAGCAKFPVCRGARSLVGPQEPPETPAEPPVELPAEPPVELSPAARAMVKHFDEVAVKHHGPDAPIALQEAALGYSPLPDLSELRDGPEPKVDDDLGVPF